MNKTIKLLLLTLLLFSINTNLVYAKAKPKLNKSSVTLYKGKKITLKVKNNKKKITWSSKNKKIATVSKKGKVTAKKVGKTYIYAKIKKGKKLKCKVTVKSKVIKPTPSKNTGLSYTDNKVSLIFKKAEIIKGKNEDTGLTKPLILIHYTYSNKTKVAQSFYDIGDLDVYQKGRQMYVNDADYFPWKYEELIQNCDVRIKNGASIDVIEYWGLSDYNAKTEINLKVIDPNDGYTILHKGLQYIN